MSGDPRGTYRWQKLRQSYAAQLPMPCWRCGLVIWPHQSWELGHLVDQVDGGTELDGLAPEHLSCSRKAAGQSQGWRGQQAMRAAKGDSAVSAGVATAPAGFVKGRLADGSYLEWDRDW